MRTRALRRTCDRPAFLDGRARFNSNFEFKKAFHRSQIRKSKRPKFWVLQGPKSGAPKSGDPKDMNKNANSYLVQRIGPSRMWLGSRSHFCGWQIKNGIWECELVRRIEPKGPEKFLKLFPRPPALRVDLRSDLELFHLILSKWAQWTSVTEEISF